VVVSSGTNDFHGTLYEYFRNEDLNANNFFRNLRGEKRPADRYNQFGGTIGGPVWIPKLYNGRDKTFFFFNYEGLRRISPFNMTSTIPDAAYRAGDFSRSSIPVIDPATGAPFAGNKIPSNRIDPAAAKIFALLPNPNSPGSVDAAASRNINNYINAGATHPSNNEITTRVDHSVGEKARLFGRFTRYDALGPATPALPGPLDNQTGDSITTATRLRLDIRTRGRRR